MQMVGWLAIVLYSTAFISGWAAIFAPYAFCNRVRLITILGPAIGAGTLAVAAPWMFERLVRNVTHASFLNPGLLLMLLAVTLSILITLGIFVFKGGRWGFAPFLSAVYGFFAAPTVRYFAWVACRMWRKYSVGEIDFGE
jgi:hypothetical protein